MEVEPGRIVADAADVLDWGNSLEQEQSNEEDGGYRHLSEGANPMPPMPRNQNASVNVNAEWHSGEEESDENEANGDEEDEEEDGDETDDDSLFGTHIAGPLELCDVERQWALDIKKAVERTPELDNLSDFWYGQLAIIEQGKMDAALERAHNLQAFRQAYGIVDSPQYGMRMIREATKLFPNYLLSFSYVQTHQHYLLVFDIAQFDLSVLRRPEAMKTCMAATYYLTHAMNPDFTAIEQGVVFVVECKGFDWHKNFGLDLLRQVWTEHLLNYPVRFKQLNHYHTGLFFNMLVSMARQFIPRDIQKKFHVGLTFDCTLDQVYAVPNMEAARAKLLKRLGEALELRYQNEAAFSLGK